MMEPERWNGQSPSLSPFLHPSMKSMSNIPRETQVEDEGIEEKTHVMEGVSGYGYGYDVLGHAESTGDSEVDARPAAVAMEEDDAESCSYDDLGSERSEEGFCEGGNPEDEEEEEEGGDMGRLGHCKSCVSAESKGGGVDLMNEMERNKLFWEACLAS